MARPDHDVVRLVQQMTAPTAYELRAMKRYLQELEGKLDHIHADLVALRERALVPRPECYPHLDEDADDDAGASAGQEERQP
jgi:hypothetical protein